MSDMVGRVKSERGLFEKIISYIPGYHGYKEKEVRRESDRLVRRQASSRLKKASDVFKRSLASGVALPESKRLSADRVISRLDLTKEKVAKSVGGYSGFFDAVKVREDRLDKVIGLDYDLISLSTSLKDRTESMTKEGVLAPTWSQDIEDLEEDIDKLEEALSKRDELLSQPAGE